MGDQCQSVFDVHEDEGTFVDCIADTDGWQNLHKVGQQTAIEATQSFL